MLAAKSWVASLIEILCKLRKTSKIMSPSVHERERGIHSVSEKTLKQCR